MELFVRIYLWSNGSIMLQLDGTGPLHQQIYRAFRNEILSRGLAPGERVPSPRALAALLKGSRNTAVSAYEQLLAEGYLETRLGATGTVVAPVLPPERLALRPSAPPGLQGRPSRRAGVRLAIAGERILKTARAGARSLGLPTFTWELTPPHMRYDFRPGRAAFGDLPNALWCRLLSSRVPRPRLRVLVFGPPQGRLSL